MIHKKPYRSRKSSKIASTGSASFDSLEGRMLLSAAPLKVAAADGAPVITIAAVRKAYEGKQAGYFQVTRTGNLAVPVPIQLAISGHAKNGVDFRPIASSLIMTPGQTKASIAVTPIDDNLLERAEDCTIAISSSSAYTVGTPGRSTIWIYDNDGATVNVTASTPTTTEGSSNPAVFTFTRTGVMNQAVKVSYSLKGTAKNGQDYTTLNNFFIIPAGKTTGTVKINAIDDLKPENDETIILSLANGWFSAGRNWKATATIRDSQQPDPTNQGEFPAGTQFVVFRGPGTATEAGHVFRVVAQGGEVPTDISRSLNQIGPAGVDSAINLSPNAKWIVLHTTRFGGSASGSLATLRADDITSGQQIKISGQVIVPADGPSAISGDGNTIIYAAAGATHTIDLWAAQNVGGTWSTRDLTESAQWNFNYNEMPAISADGTKVVFAAGNTTGEFGTNTIGVVNVDGSGLQTVVTAANFGPGAPPASFYVNRPAFASASPSVSVFFGSNFNGGADQLWRLNAGATTASPVSSDTGEVCPAVFSDGRIASLWSNRQGNIDNVLELTLRDADGSVRGTIAPGVGLPISGLGVGTWPQEPV